jgi:hypothetical protein
VVPGVNLTLADGSPAELDILGFQGERVVAGEVKTSSAGFNNLARDVALSVAIGADTHIMGCVDELSPALRAQAEHEVDRAGLSLIVLDRNDLRPGLAVQPTS